MSEIRVGPAGWSYKDWEGRVYPDPPPPGFDPLRFLSGLFSCIEINSTFYRPPDPRAAEAWARRTPEGFLFTVKVWERFSHGEEDASPSEARAFREGIAPLLRAGKLGALLLQFPWSFADSPRARDRIRRAAEALAGWAPLAVEVRHRSWGDALDFFRKEGLSFCNIDQPASRTSITGTRHVTGPVAYVRLHGRNAKAWFDPKAGRDQKYDYLYSPAQLGEWAEAVRAMSAARIFVVTNNHFEGKAVVNALQFRRALGGDVAVPEPLRTRYRDVLLDFRGAGS